MFGTQKVLSKCSTCCASLGQVTQANGYSLIGLTFSCLHATEATVGASLSQSSSPEPHRHSVCVASPAPCLRV